MIWKNNFHSDDPRELWEYLKFCIRNFTIRYSKNKAKKFKTELKNLELRVENFEKGLSSIKGIDQEYYKAKLEVEICYDYLTEGIIIRSRAQWYEEGERSTKYFLNLEKQNK